MLVTVTRTLPAGHLTVPMTALNGGDGTALGVLVTGGTTLVGVGLTVRVRVGVGLGDRVGVLDGRTVRVTDTLREGAGRRVAVAVALALGALRAEVGVEVARTRAGIAMSAPMTKKTAAMMTLGNCIQSSRPAPLRRERGVCFPDHYIELVRILPITPRIAAPNGPTPHGVFQTVDGSLMMDLMDDGIVVGRILVATPLLDDPNFRRSVVFVLEHDDAEGTLGVVLNRPTEVPVGQVLPPWGDLVTGPSVLFQGGPVALDSALALAKVPNGEEPLGWRALDDGSEVSRVGVLDLDAPPNLIGPELVQLRVFAGYAGWGAGQLRSEIEQGAWYVVAGEPGDVFVDAPERLWQAVLRRQGGDLALVSTFPDDPNLN